AHDRNRQFSILYFPLQFLYFLPLPHGQGSFRPILCFRTYGRRFFFFCSWLPETACVFLSPSSRCTFSRMFSFILYLATSSSIFSFIPSKIPMNFICHSI